MQFPTSLPRIHVYKRQWLKYMGPSPLTTSKVLLRSNNIDILYSVKDRAFQPSFTPKKKTFQMFDKDFYYMESSYLAFTKEAIVVLSNGEERTHRQGICHC